MRGSLGASQFLLWPVPRRVSSTCYHFQAKHIFTKSKTATKSCDLHSPRHSNIPSPTGWLYPVSSNILHLSISKLRAMSKHWGRGQLNLVTFCQNHFWAILRKSEKISTQVHVELLGWGKLSTWPKKLNVLKLKWPETIRTKFHHVE